MKNNNIKNEKKTIKAIKEIMKQQQTISMKIIRQNAIIQA